VKRSEEEDFRQYVAARMDRLRRSAYLLCRDWHTADDLVAVTVGKLYRNWRRAQQAERIDAYVQKILLRAWLDELRRPWRREQATAELPHDPVHDRDAVERMALLDLLAALTPRRRAAVVLRFYCDLTVDEAAEVLGCTAGTVKSLTARGLEALRARVGAPTVVPRGEEP
jgi:RNA polymerase sigma-70 factor (sigma-E family)